jgi:predicted nucleotidyltransferase
MVGDVDPVQTARAFVRETFPEARAAVLGGSAARGQATATSDLDIVVILDGPPAPYRETLRYRGWLVELFAYTPDTLREFYERDARSRRAPLATICAAGVILLGGGEAQALQRDAAAFLAAGPPPVGADELAGRRYVLTDALDDLLGARDNDERAVVAAQVLVAVAELALIVDGRWLGLGKWLLRRLQEARPETTRRLLDAYRRAVADGDAEALGEVAEAVLAEAGGRLSEGYRPPTPGR